MPNRGELIFPAALPDIAASDNGAWAILCLCAPGWLLSIYLAFASQSFDEIPALIAQSFLW